MSFWELVVIGVVALLVLGPEKLPGAIRTVTGFIAGVRQFGQQMKAELVDEIRVHELHQKLKDAEEKGLLGLTADEIAALAELKKAADSVNNPYAAITASHQEAVNVVQTAQPLALSNDTTNAAPTVPPAVVSTESHEQNKHV